MVESTLSFDRLDRAYRTARDRLTAERSADGWWTGELSTSALSTAVALTALHAAGRSPTALIDRGIERLAAMQLPDGGWGDTSRSFSNISTTLLCRSAFHAVGAADRFGPTLRRASEWLVERGARTPEATAEAVRRRYGRDRTFSVPILMMNALAGLVPWREVPRLPFELACLPQSWYRFAGLPVVSYALPALIAIGQVIHRHRPPWNPITRIVRRMARRPSLRVLDRIQPTNGGFLEAAPLTGFVLMSLVRAGAPAERVIERCVSFLEQSVRPDGSWPIDTNLSLWLTTLTVQALAGADDLSAIGDHTELSKRLIAEQTRIRHPFTGAAPGAWGWSHLPGSVPDCDDTPGALLALHRLAGPTPAPETIDSARRGVRWILDLQNRDGGWPTFCRGWGKLPFDRSGADLTAHAIRALLTWRMHLTASDQSAVTRAVDRGFRYLADQQRPDGSWLPLWFGNQHMVDDINPVYGTARVLAAYRDAERPNDQACRAGIEYLVSAQSVDHGWGGGHNTPTSVEETAVAVEVLHDLNPIRTRSAVDRGLVRLVRHVEEGTYLQPAPIGFYFAKLWYFERLYPLIFTVAALGRAVRSRKKLSP